MTPQKSSTSNIEVLKKFWNGVRPYKWAFFTTLFCITVDLVISIFVPIYYKQFFDVLSHATDTATAIPTLIHILVAIAILHAIILVFSRSGWIFLSITETRVMARLRQTAYDYTMLHSHNFFSNTFAGSLVQKINRFARSFEQLNDVLALNLLPITINFIGAVIVTWFVAPLISLVIISWVSFYTVFAIFFFRWRTKYSKEKSEAESHATAVLADNIGNYSAITLFTAHKKELAQYTEVTNTFARLQQRSWYMSEIINTLYNTLIYIVEFFVFYFAIFSWQDGTFTVGTFVLIQVYVIGLASGLNNVNRAIRGMSESISDAKEMVAILNTPHEVRDIPTAQTLTVPTGKISFDDVTFSFNQTREVIHHLNMTIAPGEKIALVGMSGAGKTTLVRLILRLFDLTSGSINIDDQNIAKVTQESLHQHISLVPQEPVLFHRSLLENIRYGRHDASDAEVIQAAKLAHCDEFISALPQKYETFVGERGVKLSGGERQRVAIARAILKNAPILILDEATSSLDSESESLIQDALDTLMKGRTTIVIAHRLSTIRKMDRIIALEDGKILEQGSHDELIKQDGSLYKKLWNLQAGGFIG